MTVIQAFVAISGWPVAKRKYQEMLMAGVPKDLFMFDYVKNEGAVSANRIKDMAAAPGQGHAVVKEEKPYRVTMDALLRDGREKEAINEWTNMIQDKRVRPTSLTFTPLVIHFARRRDLEGMEHVIALGKKHRVYQTSNGSRSILTSQIKAYSFAKQFDKAFHVWDAALADGVIPSRAAQSLILDACGHSRDYERLFSILGVLVQEPWGGVDVNVWTSAVEAFCRLHDLDSAVKVVSEIMPRKGLKPDVKLVRTLWSTEAKHNQPCKNKFVVGLVKRFGGERYVLKLHTA
ncbi:hypothetical protein BCR44DRAFT_1463121 [Catenaria anguillulae PL171]|uniref:Pentacotripeptide-repeat region of PRORP domain-containing protein n=1 Tax=Catenaria anguillulae PL171 TaxID=765915 RepID=A0A1Y2HCZ3_9FUNG|nr:hypothetical protein BCR44DRAFT_1463121 [Catenaria anguillulae PL171]